jgi:ketol-acid reductoisomerase
VKGKDLFTTEEALEKATVVQYLVSDAAQKAYWPTLKKYLNPGHGAVLLARLLHHLQGLRPRSSRRRAWT